MGATSPTARLLVETAPGQPLAPTLAYHGKRHLIDTVGAMLAGADQPVTGWAQAVVAATQGEGRCPVPGLAGRYGVLDAAYIAGVAAHSTETDDGYRLGSIHPGAVVVPAVLSLAWARRVRGADLLAAMVAGYHAIAVVSALVHPTLRRRGFHPTAAVGPLGAALAAAHLMGLDDVRRGHALGIAASAACGLFAFKGGGADVKRLHAGQAASGGLLAALMAEQGCEGPPSVLEAADGFLQAFTGHDPSDPVAWPSLQRPAIADCYIKPYACCRHLQPAVEALRAVCEAHGVLAGDIGAIEVETYSIAAEHGAVPWRSMAEAQLSFPYVMAAAASPGPLGAPTFGDAARSGPEREALCRRVTVRATAEMDRRYPRERPARVTVRTAAGTWTAERAEARGAPEMPLSDAEVEVKFLAGSRLEEEQLRRAVAALWALEDVEDVSGLLEAMAEEET